jgi:hypothetical protein
MRTSRRTIHLHLSHAEADALCSLWHSLSRSSLGVLREPPSATVLRRVERIVIEAARLSDLPQRHNALSRVNNSEAELQSVPENSNSQ